MKRSAAREPSQNVATIWPIGAHATRSQAGPSGAATDWLSVLPRQPHACRVLWSGATPNAVRAWRWAWYIRWATTGSSGCGHISDRPQRAERGCGPDS
jgi:hypothetical protein